MHEVMTDPGQTDALAAEYVLGTLDADELAQAQALAGTAPEFADKVKRWERRFGELHLMVEPVDPEPRIWERIKAKMPIVRQMPEPPPAVAPDAAAAAPPTPATEPATGPMPLPASPPAGAEASAAIETPVPTPSAAAEALVEAPPVTAPPSTQELPSTKELPPTQLPPPPASTEELPTPPVVPPLPAPPSSAPQVVGPDAPALQPPPLPTAEPRPPLVPLEQIALRRRLGRWRAWALLMTLVVVAATSLVGAWRLAPEQLPPRLQPAEMLRWVGIVPETPVTPVRPPAPPESQFDE